MSSVVSGIDVGVFAGVVSSALSEHPAAPAPARVMAAAAHALAIFLRIAFLLRTRSG
ncbi:hypothetical protein GFS60_06363 (plasmid) [Rhodococcus sp. WAY2]|nr:hypothetical protein GFS60_06363 [Rhodococcus sp. WAY2]